MRMLSTAILGAIVVSTFAACTRDSPTAVQGTAGIARSAEAGGGHTFGGRNRGDSTTVQGRPGTVGSGHASAELEGGLIFGSGN